MMTRDVEEDLEKHGGEMNKCIPFTHLSVHDFMLGDQLTSFRAAMKQPTFCSQSINYVLEMPIIMASFVCSCLCRAVSF